MLTAGGDRRLVVYLAAYYCHYYLKKLGTPNSRGQLPEGVILDDKFETQGADAEICSKLDEESHD